VGATTGRRSPHRDLTAAAGEAKVGA
jgi:hypothetical protein